MARRIRSQSPRQHLYQHNERRVPRNHIKKEIVFMWVWALTLDLIFPTYTLQDGAGAWA